MVDYTVEKAQPVPTDPQQYIFTYTKTVKDVNGKDVIIPDRTENVTLEQLESQIASYQAQIDEIRAKIDAMTKII